jgi:hypothetical protein
MKCPVCGKDEIVAKAETSYEPVFGRDIDGYYPICPECKTRFYPKELFSTPELALEAMRPVVSEELVEFIFAMMMQSGKIYTECVMQHQIKEKGIELMKAVIKQELEKFYAKD